MSKEKYGTFRDNPNFYTGWWPIFGLVKPGYMYYRWPKPIYKFEMLLNKLTHQSFLSRAISSYQAIVYNYAVQQACKKYPEIVDEIVADLDGYALIKPGIFGTIDGETVHNKHWTRVE